MKSPGQRRYNPVQYQCFYELDNARATCLQEVFAALPSTSAQFTFRVFCVVVKNLREISEFRLRGFLVVPATVAARLFTGLSGRRVGSLLLGTR